MIPNILVRLPDLQNDVVFLGPLHGLRIAERFHFVGENAIFAAAANIERKAAWEAQRVYVVLVLCIENESPGHLEAKQRREWL